VSPEAAQIVVSAIAAIGTIVWLAGLQFLARSRRIVKKNQPEGMFIGDGSAAVPPNWLAGSAEVDGRPAELATRAAAIFAKASPFGFARIEEKSDERVTFANQMTGQPLRRGTLRFSDAGRGRSEVVWIAELANVDWLLRVGTLVQVLGLLALVVGGWAMFTWVASSANPAIRWQSLQMLQVVHVLWPPFLFGVLYRRCYSQVAAQFEALTHNLPYGKD
jgi:hypothetical protein